MTQPPTEDAGPQGSRRLVSTPFVTALIPVKSLAAGKSRLSRTLDLERRMQLTRESLRRVVHVLQNTHAIAEIVVISVDEAVAEWADVWRVTFLREEKRGLNEALAQARQHVALAPAILVLHSDLAALSVNDVESMIALCDAGERCVVIAPDRHGHGTNALLLKPPAVIDFEFGVNSAHRHIALAEAQGVQPILYHSESISLDLDSPDDLELYWGQW
jgi:2-phospho-L-lactate guanylyltransferase